jgi:WD40 repeat protein
MTSNAGNDFLLVHRCRFVQNQPSPITALAINEGETLLALARENSSLEVWNLEHNFYQQRIIPSSGTIRRLNFVNSERSENQVIAASGLDGVLRLYDINMQTKLLEYYVGCGPVWDQCRVAEMEDLKLDEELLISNHDVLVFAGDDSTVRVVFVPRDLTHVTNSSMSLLDHIVLRSGGKQRFVSVASQLSSDGKTVWIWAGSQDGRLHRWDLTVGAAGSHASGLTAKSTSPTLSIDLTRGILPWTLQVYNSQAIEGQVLTTGAHTVILGDSEGNLSVFDGAMGVLTQSLIHHKADILRIVLSPSKTSCFSVGVDNTISLFQRASNTTALGSADMDVDNKPQTAPWVFVGQRRSHTHDILAAVAGQNRLYSGGVDTKLMVHEYRDMLKLPGRAFLPFAQNPALVASLTQGTPTKRDRLVVQLENRLQIWRLGKPLHNGNIDPKTNHHDILEEQALLLDITPKITGRIQCHAASARAHRLAISDSVATKVFCIRERGAVQTNEESENRDASAPNGISSRASGSKTMNGSLSSPRANKSGTAADGAAEEDDQFLAAFSDPVLNVEKKMTIKGASSHLLFTANGLLVRATPQTHLIQTWDVSDPDRPSLVHTFHDHAQAPRQQAVTSKSSALNAKGSKGRSEQLLKPIHLMSSSPCGKYLATCDLYNRVFVFSLESNQLVYVLPPFEEQISAICFDPEEVHLAVALTSNKFYIYHIESKSMTEWSRQHSEDLPSKLTDSQELIIGMVFHPSVPGMIFVYGHTFIFYAQTAGSGNRLWKLIKSYQPLFVDFVDDESIAVIERPWLKVLQHLPAPFYRQRYGT